MLLSSVFEAFGFDFGMHSHFLASERLLVALCHGDIIVYR